MNGTYTRLAETGVIHMIGRSRVFCVDHSLPVTFAVQQSRKAVLVPRLSCGFVHANAII